MRRLVLVLAILTASGCARVAAVGTVTPVKAVPTPGLAVGVGLIAQDGGSLAPGAGTGAGAGTSLVSQDGGSIAPKTDTALISQDGGGLGQPKAQGDVQALDRQSAKNSSGGFGAVPAPAASPTHAPAVTPTDPPNAHAL